MADSGNQQLVVRGARLIDGTGSVRDGGVSVTINGNRIVAIGDSNESATSGAAPVVDLSDCTLMPGLIDSHLHLTTFNVLTFRNHRIATFETTPQSQLLYALVHAQMCMEMGFTSLRDLGGISYTGHLTAELVALRDAIDRGVLAGPRLKVAGWAMVTGSHLDLVIPRNALRKQGVTADGPWELRRLAREQLRVGCDVVKTSASGGGGTDQEEADIRNMTYDELRAIVEEAHAAGKLCSCHCFTAEAQKMAVKAGVDTIEHCVFTDDEALEIMKEEGKILVPTLAHRTDRAIEIRRQMGASEFVVDKMRRIQPHARESFKRAHAAGITIAMGTDTQIDPEMGSNSMELEIYVDYGMSPMEAIQTATKNAAQALGMARDLGTIEPGKLADIIAVKGNPLDDIRILQQKDKILMVMKAGRIYVDRRPGHTRTITAEPNWEWQLA